MQWKLQTPFCTFISCPYCCSKVNLQHWFLAAGQNRYSSSVHGLLLTWSFHPSRCLGVATVMSWVFFPALNESFLWARLKSKISPDWQPLCSKLWDRNLAWWGSDKTLLCFLFFLCSNHHDPERYHSGILVSLWLGLHHPAHQHIDPWRVHTQHTLNAAVYAKPCGSRHLFKKKYEGYDDIRDNGDIGLCAWRDRSVHVNALHGLVTTSRETRVNVACVSTIGRKPQTPLWHTELGSCCTSQQNRKFLVSSAAYSNSLYHPTSAYVHTNTLTHTNQVVTCLHQSASGITAGLNRILVWEINTMYLEILWIMMYCIVKIMYYVTF